MENNQTAARAARRFLTERVRDDWDWPSLPEYWSASDEEVRNATHFRERYYGSTSDLESEPEGAPADPYKFDSPDAIGTALESRAEGLKRKRRADLEAEMGWNEGLAQFVRRRDAWTGVDSVRRYGTHRLAANLSEGDSASTPNSGMLSDSSSTNNIANSAPVDALVPVAVPMLAGNPIREKIDTRRYHDIYEKVVLTSRSPTVPINLADMTRALVQGWKENGEWPPKAGPLDPLAGRKKGALAGLKIDHGEGPFLAHHPHMKKGVDSVRRIFHLNGHCEHPGG
jgi:hypothetical protein